MITKSTNYIVAYEFLEKMNKKAFHYKYEGNWLLVKKLVSSQRIYYLDTYIEFLFANFSPEDIFGNIVRRISFYMNHYKVLRKSRRTTKVRYPQRKRGYSDKGSRRPSEKWLPKIYTELYNYEEEINKLEPVEVTPPHHKTEWINNRRSGS